MDTLAVRGVNGQLRVTSDKITISRKGALALLGHGLKGDKEISIEQITSIQFKQAGTFFNGYIQFAFVGGQESKSGIFDAARDENSIMFNVKQQPDFLKAKDLIEEHRQRLRRSAKGAISTADELEKLASLKERGVISNEDFQAAKRKILGI